MRAVLLCVALAGCGSLDVEEAPEPGDPYASNLGGQWDVQFDQGTCGDGLTALGFSLRPYMRYDTFSAMMYATIDQFSVVKIGLSLTGTDKGWLVIGTGTHGYDLLLSDDGATATARVKMGHIQGVSDECSTDVDARSVTRRRD